MATQKQIFTEAKNGIDSANHTTSGLIEYLRYIFGELVNATGGGGGGSEVSYTQTLATGTKTGTIEIDGVSTDMYAPTPAAPTEVEVTQVVSTGTKIATISVDDVPTDIYAPASGGGGGFTKIWENNSPTTAFAGQTVSIDDNAYEKFLIIYENAGTTSYRIIGDLIVPLGEDARIAFLNSSSNSLVLNERDVTISKNSTKIDFVFGNGSSMTQGSSATADNTKCIPYQIYAF